MRSPLTSEEEAALQRDANALKCNQSYLVDLTLYNGSHLQSENIRDRYVAKRTAEYFRCQTMVERAIVIQINTGEIRYDYPNIVAIWRLHGETS